MDDRTDVSLGSRRTARGVVLVDHACGECVACAAGAGLWCIAPTAEGRDLTPTLREHRAAAVAEALLAVAALAAAPATATVLVLDDPTSPLALFAGAIAGGRLVTAADAAEARAALADEPTGRAAVVVAGTDARAAVRAVRRGGHVCVAHADAVLPSVTELVQREVTLLSPPEVATVAARIGTELWAALAAA